MIKLITLIWIVQVGSMLSQGTLKVEEGRRDTQEIHNIVAFENGGSRPQTKKLGGL